MKNFELVITETACNSPRDSENSSMFNKQTIECESIEEVREKIFERYGKINIKRAHKIYVDSKIGAKEVGFLHSFWNKDWSLNSKNWFQTDWITISEVTENTVLV